MSNEVALRSVESNKSMSFMPQSYAEMERYCEKIANSSFCPKDFKGKTGDVFIAIQMGIEVGLQPLAALQNIAVINGRPSIWGDAQLAIARAHPAFLSVREWMEGSFSAENAIAYCAIKRRGQEEEIRTFSYAQAKKAGLIGTNVWAKYPERMLQMRARGFCVRDVFGDALKGLQCAEEQQDIVYVTQVERAANDVVTKKTTEKLEAGIPLSQTYVVDQNGVDKYLEIINNSTSIDELKTVYNEAKTFCNGDKAASNEISKATNNRKTFLNAAKKTVSTPPIVDAAPIESTDPVKTQSNAEWANEYDKKDVK